MSKWDKLLARITMLSKDLRFEVEGDLEHEENDKGL